MDTPIDLDETLLERAFRVSGVSTRRQAVEDALRRVIRLAKEEGVDDFFGGFPQYGSPGLVRQRGPVDTSVDVDEALLDRAVSVSGLSARRAVVEEALWLVVQLDREGKVRDAFGRFPLDRDAEQPQCD